MKQIIKILLVTACLIALVACGSKGEDSNAASNTEPTVPSVQDLGNAKRKNPDTVGWLCLPGTEINDAVMQTANNDDYLRRDENGKESIWGCYFADYYSILIDRDSLRQNTVIYGHSQSDENVDGKKFSQLFRYLDIDFLKEHHEVYLTVGEEELKFEICAVYFTGDDFYYINPTPSDEGFELFAGTIAAKNEFIFASGNLSPEDKLLTLSTCAFRYDTAKTGNQRLVVMARLIDQDAATAAFDVKANPNPQRP